MRFLSSCKTRFLSPLSLVALATFGIATFGIAGLDSSGRASAEVFELRRYQVPPEKLNLMTEGFGKALDGLLRNHGMQPIGYWTAVDQGTVGDNFIYVIRHDNRDAADKAWSAFAEDPKWSAAQAEFPVGDLLQPTNSIFLTLTDYSDEPADAMEKDDAETSEKGLFELRIYQAAEDKLEKLDARFSDHTIGLFSKHGIQSIAYWHVMDPPKSADHLVYIIRHKDAEAAKQSWADFVSDPDWKTAAANSGVGKLMQAPESIYMLPTAYSPIR